jgi:histidinol-phosphate phosphatase family protein
MSAYSIVVPTVGRPSLGRLLAALEAGRGPLPEAVVLVDDRRSATAPLPLPPGVRLAGRTHVLPGAGRGPAAARNAGWRATATPWVAFLDDDVLPPADWPARLAADLAGLPDEAAGSQGRIVVPLPASRPATDWERCTAGLATARWATADMAYRRDALVRVGGFDERFPRAYREDADLALRMLDAGYGLLRGSRVVRHPVRPADRWVSVRAQAGNADDAVMRRLHGAGWRGRAGAPTGRLRRHLAVVAAGGLALAAALARRPRLAAAAGLGWLAGTAEFAAARIRPGPRDRGEVVAMLLSSVAIPPLAAYHRARGLVVHRRATPWAVERAASDARRPAPEAVLFDRDGTLIRDVPYNGDTALVEPMPGARTAVGQVRAREIPVGVVTNQSGVARGLLDTEDVRRVNARVEELLGPMDVWQVCPHRPADRCDCRKPAPGMVLAAAAELGVPVDRCVLIGDIGADVEAALAAGARAVLVPTDHTRGEEVGAAAATPGCAVADDLPDAVAVALGERPPAYPATFGDPAGGVAAAAGGGGR